jgi:3alpha(or 20beta)-hydroxysteroid dehydrogenase
VTLHNTQGAQRSGIAVVDQELSVIPELMVASTLLEHERGNVVDEHTVCGLFLGMPEVFPVMKKAGGGSIVNVSSISGMRALPGHAAYGSTKWAVRGMTKYAATEFGRHGIRVNSTHPGFIDTVMLEEELDEVNDAIPDVTPLGRRGTVEELAEVTLYLACDASSYINGAEVTIDCGTSI